MTGPVSSREVGPAAQDDVTQAPGSRTVLTADRSGEGATSNHHVDEDTDSGEAEFPPVSVSHVRERINPAPVDNDELR
jgi:hypothetical protein